MRGRKPIRWGSVDCELIHQLGRKPMWVYSDQRGSLGGKAGTPATTLFNKCIGSWRLERTYRHVRHPRATLVKLVKEDTHVNAIFIASDDFEVTCIIMIDPEQPDQLLLRIEWEGVPLPRIPVRLSDLRRLLGAALNG